MATSPTRDQQPRIGTLLGCSIDGGSLRFTKLLGVGIHGEVYRALDQRTNKLYAVKVLSRTPTPIPSRQQPEADAVDGRSLSHEVALYSRLPAHENIIRLERMLHSPNQVFLVMEYCVGDNIYEAVSNSAHFLLPANYELVRRLFLQLVLAVEHCHSHGVFHRDIKPENVLVTQDRLHVKLIDFGMSTDQQLSAQIYCGSPHYMSPECHGGINGEVKRYAPAPNDVWSLGIVLLNLVVGRSPWSCARGDDPHFMRYYAGQTMLFQNIHATQKFEHIIRRALDVNPSTRCTVAELRQLVENCPQFINPAGGPLHKNDMATSPLPSAQNTSNVAAGKGHGAAEMSVSSARPNFEPQPVV